MAPSEGQAGVAEGLGHFLTLSPAGSAAVPQRGPGWEGGRHTSGLGPDDAPEEWPGGGGRLLRCL